MLEGKFDVKESGCSLEMAKEMLFTLPVFPNSGEICLVHNSLVGVMSGGEDRKKYLKLCRRFGIGRDSGVIIEYNEKLGRFYLQRVSEKDDFSSFCGSASFVKARFGSEFYNSEVYIGLRDRFLRKAFDLGYAVESCSLYLGDFLLVAGLGKKPESTRLFLNSGSSEEKEKLENWFYELAKKYNFV